MDFSFLGAQIEFVWKHSEVFDREQYIGHDSSALTYSLA